VVYGKGPYSPTKGQWRRVVRTHAEINCRDLGAIGTRVGTMPYAPRRYVNLL
jgi:hypothetical protein